MRTVGTRCRARVSHPTSQLPHTLDPPGLEPPPSPIDEALVRRRSLLAARTVGRRYGAGASTAVQRNRVRRLVRESFRQHQHQLPPVDIVIGARERARTATSEQLRQGLQQIWDRISTTSER